jgi:23S rRNA (cytidine1920-2'-O)/16S rRNA (cytidine1409-2'-O)-methyltransferase
VLLERGAAHVHAVDVGHGQLAPELRRDPRVSAHEGVNLRDLTLASLGGDRVDLVVADVSFISLRLLVAPLLSVVNEHGLALLMVKPWFEDWRGVSRLPGPAGNVEWFVRVRPLGSVGQPG